MFNSTKRKRGEDMEESNKKDKRKLERDLICDWCKVELPDEKSMRQHLLEQTHKQLNDPAGERRRIEQKCGLFIRGYSPDLPKDVMLTYFFKYGKILWVHFDHSYLLLDYKKPEAAEKVINRSHYLGGRRLMINYRQPRKQAFRTAKEESLDYIQMLKDIPSFDDQVLKLVQNLQPAAEQQFPQYNKLCEDIYNILRHSFPYCRIHPFGSTITGLGFTNSDVDVFISGVKKGSNDKKFLYMAKNLLIKSRLFFNVLVIPQAKIPILKCIHGETGINCDINLRNMLGVCNSHLINYYMNLDPKLRQLMVVLKFWAKTHKIAGQNHLFTNYSLILMLLFFLQHHPFRFPPVLALQQAPEVYNNQDGWNGGFQPIPFMSSELQSLSLIQLFEKFFSFYIDYEYGINVICPYLGTSMRKELFKEPEKLSDLFDTYKQYLAANGVPLKVDTSVCIQDPFEHSRNTTPIVSDATLELFVGFCRLGKKFCGEKSGPILFKLLTEVPQDMTALIQPQLSQFSIPMRPGLKYIEEKYESTPERHKAWFECVTKFTKTVLEDFFLFSLTEVNGSPSKTKHIKTDGQADVYENTNYWTCYKCTGKLNLWQSRKVTAKYNKYHGEDVNLGILEKEKAITQQLCSHYKNISQMQDIINFEINLELLVADSPKVAINVKKVNAYKNCFKSFVTFLSVKLPIWFKTFEQEQN